MVVEIISGSMYTCVDRFLTGVKTRPSVARQCLSRLQHPTMEYSSKSSSGRTARRLQVNVPEGDEGVQRCTFFGMTAMDDGLMAGAQLTG
jgi:hypothetical protein